MKKVFLILLLMVFGSFALANSTSVYVQCDIDGTVYSGKLYDFPLEKKDWICVTIDNQAYLQTSKIPQISFADHRYTYEQSDIRYVAGCRYFKENGFKRYVDFLEIKLTNMYGYSVLARLEKVSSGRLRVPVSIVAEKTGKYCSISVP